LGAQTTRHISTFDYCVDGFGVAARLTKPLRPRIHIGDFVGGSARVNAFFTMSERAAWQAFGWVLRPSAIVD
jgi:hypothetical protein